MIYVQWVIGIIGLVAFVLFSLAMGDFFWRKSREWKEDDAKLGRRK